MITPSSRLRDQGFVNQHRKLILRLLAVALAAYLFYVPSPWTPGPGTVQFMLASGSLLLFTGVIGRVFASISIGGMKDRMIVRTELYSVCRNPLYFSSFLMTVGFGLLTGRGDFAVLAALAYLAVFHPMMANEARFLRARFPDFGDYEKSVPLFVPNFALWKSRDSFEVNFRLVSRTLLDASLSLPAVPVIFLLRSHF